MDQQATAEYRYRAVCEVLAGSPIGEVALRYGTTRQSLDTWRRRFTAEGKAGLADHSRRPRTSPTRLGSEVEALICRLRREHPRWGARRICHELAGRDLAVVPSRATVHRVLTRNGLIDPQAQAHKRAYKRWQREAPMHLWQLDIVGGVPLAEGRECKLLTGIDDHSRFVVIATVLVTSSAREVAEAFTAAMRRYGVPSEVLADNGGQFTGRHLKPLPVQVLFEKVCHDNGITQRLTKPRSPTTTGKIERFHKTLRAEFLDHVAPFASITVAQEAIDGWITSYNQQRPHQALDMAVPASLFRPNGPTRLEAIPSMLVTDPVDPELSPLRIGVIEPPPGPLSDGAAVEFEVRVSPTGNAQVRSGRQVVSLHRSMAGRTVTVWADLRSIHLCCDGHVIRTVASRLLPEDLRYLAMRGARAAGPAPERPALRRANGTAVVEPGQAVEIDRAVTKDGLVAIGGINHLVGFAWAGRRVTLRLDGHLLYAITDNALIGTWPCPISNDKIGRLLGARAPAAPLPPPPLPAGSLRAQRKVHASGRIRVAGQNIKLGLARRGKIVTVVIEDTHFRILHGDEEIAVRPRRSTAPITRLHVTGAGAKPAERQASPDDKTSNMS
ncbi:IS481 family transposase [Frankia sp. Mgl5]|uniref:IS481 family transposase n=1 Tax=Frankia sp. Mgl5 TaxID=2933793 RepID=UPI00200F0255|nr:IS481 family transposase [Frankia sp. Mgl5]MCK9928859.1 IS481 family transposase [Frankia sp. Mgl5]